MLKTLRSAKFKTSQSFTAPSDSTYLTLSPWKILRFFLNYKSYVCLCARCLQQLKTDIACEKFFHKNSKQWKAHLTFSCSKSALETLEKDVECVFIDNFEHISHLFLVLDFKQANVSWGYLQLPYYYI